MQYARDDMIVTAEWLAEHLDQPGIRIIDCTVWFRPRPVGSSIIESGHEHWLSQHIPGAGYLHMVDDLSDPESSIPFTIAPQSRINKRLGKLGITENDTVIIYSAGTPIAATRAWWVLVNSGLPDVRILDGGFKAWLDGGYEIAEGAEKFSPRTFQGHRNLAAIISTDQMAAALENASATLANALAPEQHAGTGGPHYGRPGRIPGSCNLPARDLLDYETGRFAAPHKMAELLARELAEPDTQIITYCGGGIAATTTLFALQLMGHHNLAMYDNSLLDWSANPDLPMETD